MSTAPVAWSRRAVGLVIAAVLASACGGGVKASSTGGTGGASGSTAGTSATTTTGSTGATVGTGGTNASGGTGGMVTGTTGASTGGGVSAGTAGTNGGSASTTASTTGIISDPTPCKGATDARLVVAPQRILRLTLREVVNSVRAFVSSNEAESLVTSGKFGNIGADADRSFPPLDANREGTQIDDAKFLTLDAMAQDVASFVSANFASVTGCSSTGTSATIDACATTYLNTLAAREYRRPLSADEQSTFSALFTSLRNGVDDGRGNLVTFTAQEASELVVNAIFDTPQFLYRSEIGDTTKPSTLPPGVPLTQYELATDVAFFLTDSPPDAALSAQAAAGTLSTNLRSEVDRLLATQQAKDWLRTVMYTFFGLNYLENQINVVDPTKYPDFSAQLVADEGTEAVKFLDNVLWNAKLTDLLTSRTTFLNPTLANTIYRVPAPPGSTLTNFVETTLPADRVGLLTNAAFLTTAARSDRPSVVARGKRISRITTCIPTPPPPADLNTVSIVSSSRMQLSSQTAQQEVAARNAIPLCAGCHSTFDGFGLALDSYDNLGRYRTIDDLGKPVDTHATLPPALGSAPVANVLEVAQKLASSPVFTNCMAQTVLQYALTDIYSSPVPLPSPPGSSPVEQACATTDIANKLTGGTTQAFSDLVRAVAASPAFALRTPAQ